MVLLHEQNEGLGQLHVVADSNNIRQVGVGHVRKAVDKRLLQDRKHTQGRWRGCHLQPGQLGEDEHTVTVTQRATGCTGQSCRHCSQGSVDSPAASSDIVRHSCEWFRTNVGTAGCDAAMVFHQSNPTLKTVHQQADRRQIRGRRGLGEAFNLSCARGKASPPLRRRWNVSTGAIIVAFAGLHGPGWLTASVDVVHGRRTEIPAALLAE
jgi:hypothetical protein